MSGEKDKLVGRAKQSVGDLTDDTELEQEGENQESAGKLKDAVNDATEKIEDSIDAVREKFDN